MPRAKAQQAKINITPPTEATAAAGAADLTKPGKQGRGLASTNLSGMRSMVGSYQAGKPTLGAG